MWFNFLMTTTHQHRGYTIRKVEGRSPVMASNNGLNFSIGSTRYTEYTADVRYTNGVRGQISRKRLGDVKRAIDEAIKAGHLMAK